MMMSRAQVSENPVYVRPASFRACGAITT